MAYIGWLHCKSFGEFPFIISLLHKSRSSYTGLKNANTKFVEHRQKNTQIRAPCVPGPTENGAYLPKMAQNLLNEVFRLAQTRLEATGALFRRSSLRLPEKK